MKKRGGNNQKNSKVLKKVGILLLNFVLFYTILRLIILLSENYRNPTIYYVGTTLYMLSAGAVFIAFFVLNGFSIDRRERTIDDLPEKWSDERKMEFLRRQPERQKKAQSLIYILMPMVVSIFISYIELNFFK